MNDIFGKLMLSIVVSGVYIIIIVFPIKQYIFLEKARFLNYSIKEISDDIRISREINMNKVMALNEKINKMNIKGKLKISYYKKKVLFNEENGEYSVIYEYHKKIPVKCNYQDKVYITFIGEKNYVRYGGMILNGNG